MQHMNDLVKFRRCALYAELCQAEGSLVCPRLAAELVVQQCCACSELLLAGLVGDLQDVVEVQPSGDQGDVT